jgi:dCTP deaminase
MPLNDREIIRLCQREPQGITDPRQGGVHPIRPPLLHPWARSACRPGVISYGVTSYGYDLRLARTAKLFDPLAVTGAIDPKAFRPDLLREVAADVFTLPPHSYMLGSTVERFCMPDDLVGVVVGKSTYARCGLIVNCTPVEPGWEGYLTLELANTTPLPILLYAGEGVAQVQFHRGEPPLRGYRGVYQGQGEGPVTPRVLPGEEAPLTPL